MLNMMEISYLSSFGRPRGIKDTTFVSIELLAVFILKTSIISDELNE